MIVLSPTTAAECYSLTCRAFDLAERFRVPVFLATDKETVLTTVTVDEGDFINVPVRSRTYAPRTDNFIPYRAGAIDEVPAMAAYGGAHLLRFTTSTHDEYGQITKDPEKVRRLNLHLAEKVEKHIDEVSTVKADLQAGANTLILSYGVTSQAVEEVVETLRGLGKLISSLTVYSLWPVPEKEIRQAIQGASRVIIPELNLGQYRLEIQRIAPPDVHVVGINRVDGELISPEEIIEQGGL